MEAENVMLGQILISNLIFAQSKSLIEFKYQISSVLNIIDWLNLINFFFFEVLKLKFTI